MSLDGRKAVVCGASKGIGRAIAEELAELGASVVLVARDQSALENLKSSMVNSERHHVLGLDLSNSKEVSEKFNSIAQQLGPIHILVCNSGGPKAGPLINAEAEDFISGFKTHVIANQLMTQALVPGMQQEKYGRIINIISTSVKVPIPNLGVSNTIRGAVASWAKTMAGELGPMGITVNNVLPGFTATDRLENLKKAASDRMNCSIEEVEKKWKATIPVGRFADPKETAKSVAFLASSHAAYINGINLPVDGGRTGCL